VTEGHGVVEAELLEDVLLVLLHVVHVDDGILEDRMARMGIVKY
jgi:hypothetical protein